MKTPDLINADQLREELDRLHNATNAIGSDLETVSMLMSKSFAPIFRGNYSDPKECDEPKAGDVITSGDSTLIFGYDGDWVELSCNDSIDARSEPMDVQGILNEMQDKIDALSKKAIPRFHCIYCGTQNFEYEGVSTTPQCPNCGALMRSSEAMIHPEYNMPYYPSF